MTKQQCEFTGNRCVKDTCDNCGIYAIHCLSCNITEATEKVGNEFCKIADKIANVTEEVYNKYYDTSVLIKGMKLPKSCPCELTGVGYDTYCSFTYGIPSRVQEYYECCEKETRPNWCPLIEVRNIMNALYIETFSTIIQAEEGET